MQAATRRRSKDSALVLHVAGSELAITRHHHVSFPGDVAAETRGVGRALDLNVMSRLPRRAHVEVSQAETHRHSPAIWPLTRARHLAVFAFEPTTLREGGRDAHALGAHDTLVHLAGGASADYTASAPVAWIRF